MRKKGIGLGIAFLVLAGAALYSTGAKAYRSDMSVKGPNYTPERHEAMEEAFKSGDYNAWKNLMEGKGRVTQVVNEQNFNQFAKMHSLMLEGKTEEASKIRQELGLGQKNGQGQGMRNKGQNRSGHFSDANGDGICDRMQ